MSKKKRYWTLYLMDMLESIRRIEVYTKDIGYEEFLRNNMIKDAVVRNIEVIGEAARNIPKEIQAKYNHIPWAEIIATRNVIAHDYFEIDYKIVWNIICKHLPTLKKELELMLQEIDNIPKL
jgi:uncharacterized protein with HEPN domain